MTSYTLRQIWLSGDQVGPHFRWGKVATLVTSILVGLLILSLVWPEIIRKVLAGLFMFVGAFVVVTYLVFAIPATRYNLLKLLLKWRGWAYNPRSAWSRIYLAIVGLLGGTAPRLWELQPALPSLPVPDLAHTCKLYLSSVEPLLSKEEFETTKKVVAEFQKAGGPGEKLQSMLIERARVTPNWLIEWWERFVYLRGRMPIAVYSNWYGLDRIDVLLKTPVARCANLVSRMLEFKKLIDTKKLEPHRIQGTVPLCMWQYSRIFGTVRVPGIEEDHLEFHSESRHVTVICCDQYFKLEVYKKSGTPLKPTELQSQLQRIHDMAQESAEKNVNIAALTSQNRDVWAKQREELKSMDAKNVETLKCIEESLFVIVFDESEPTTVDEMCHIGMHRNGKPLWFDKNFNLIITKNGRCITNVDHTWADAVTMVTVYDFVFGTESSIDHWVKPSSLPDLPKPQRLQWQLTADMSKQVDVAQKHIDTLAASLELHVLKFQHFGKELVKRAGMSPDAFCQTAIQLAWYRLRGECALTYESGGTVRFLCGRTETVRSLSCDMKKFCELMAQADASLDVDAQEEHHTARFNQLKLATKACVRYMRKATNGDGADRHLLGLKILAAGSGMPLPALFTDKAYQLQFKLSSSQTPAHSTLGGGFAPLAEDGYGMSYVVSHERLWFHISAYKAHPLTDVYKMADSLEKALLDMRDVLLHSPKLSTDLSQRKFRIQRAE